MVPTTKPTTTDKPGADSPGRRVLAWSVHLLTASGVICCLKALEATFSSQWRVALLWLLVAVVIDAVDGTLARWAAVKQVLPNFDGALLDNLVDFVGYVLVPAIIIDRARLVPAVTSFPVACLICVASAYQFCQSDAKTSDNFFKGFPSYWNIVVVYLLALKLGPWPNLLIVGLLVSMVFVPVKYLYPSRASVGYGPVMPLTLSWAAMLVAILWQLPEPSPFLVWTSLLYVGYYFLAGLYFTLRSAPRPS